METTTHISPALGPVLLAAGVRLALPPGTQQKGRSRRVPKPWRVGRKGLCAVISDAAVPTISGGDDIEYYGGFLVAESIFPDHAPLIAAAPEMLDVLMTLENDGGDIPDWMWERIRAVIAKALGEEG